MAEYWIVKNKKRYLWNTVTDMVKELGTSTWVHLTYLSATPQEFATDKLVLTKQVSEWNKPKQLKEGEAMPKKTEVTESTAPWKEFKAESEFYTYRKNELMLAYEAFKDDIEAQAQMDPELAKMEVGKVTLLAPTAVTNDGVIFIKVTNIPSSDTWDMLKETIEEYITTFTSVT